MLSTRPYYSVGSFTFTNLSALAPPGIEAPPGSGIFRTILKASAGQKINFFSYGIGDTMEGVGILGRPADDCDTNIVERGNTNNENVVIEGCSASARGVSVRFGVVTTSDQSLTDALTTGSLTVEDVASQITPPETTSPLTLEDALFRAIGPKTILRLEWNRKAGDYVGTVDQFGEGGGKSYLRSNGEPNTLNYFRIPEGWIWRREGAPGDTILNVSATLCEDVFVFVTYPLTWASVVGPPTIQNLIDVRLCWKLRLHCRSLYEPSQNV